MEKGDVPVTETQNRLVTQSLLEAILRDLGVAPGGDVMVHAALSRLGHIVNGARDVIDALAAVIGADGTILVPAHANLTDPALWRKPPVPEDWVAVIRAEMKPFDPHLTPVFRRGALPDALLRHPATRRSPHPQAAVAALGAKAEWYTASHPLHQGHGADSPYNRLRLAGGQVLLMGVGLESCTVLHLAECLAECPYTRQQPVAVLQVDGSGHRSFVRLQSYGGSSAHFEKLRPVFAGRGWLREHHLDDYLFTLLDVGPALDWLIERLRTEPDYLSTP